MVTQPAFVLDMTYFSWAISHLSHLLLVATQLGIQLTDFDFDSSRTVVSLLNSKGDQMISS
jgi:hypothetical protein